MNEKLKWALVFVVGLLVGIILIKCMSRSEYEYRGGMHRMPDGTMMSNDPDMSMKHSMMGMMAGLQGKTGDEFDKAFLAEMIVHHQGAVEMAQSALKNAKHQEIIDLSNAIITAQEKEIDAMVGWLDKWYK